MLQPSMQGKGWPEPYVYVYIHNIFGDFQAKNTCAHCVYICGFGQPNKLKVSFHHLNTNNLHPFLHSTQFIHAPLCWQA
jgi:hypothetical protein